MNQPHPLDRPPPEPPRWRPRFGILWIGGVSALFCFVMAGVSYLIRSLQQEDGRGASRLVFFGIVMGGPVLLLVAVSLTRSAWDWWNRQR